MRRLTLITNAPSTAPIVMSAHVSFATRSGLDIRIPEPLVAADNLGATTAPVANVSRAVNEALAAPLEFPALASATVPGDRVVIALEAAVPELANVVAGMVSAALAAGVEPTHLTLVQTGAGAAMNTADPRSRLEPTLATEVQHVVHDAQSRDGLAYLAADKQGQTVLLNRHLCDADLVIPVTTNRLAESWGYDGPLSGLLPALGPAPGEVELEGTTLQPAAIYPGWADEVGWLLGLGLMVQVVPSAAGGVQHVLAGAPAAVEREAGVLSRQLWRLPIPRPVPLVVASLTGDTAQQTWSNVARAAVASERVTTPDGAIAICSDVAMSPFDDEDRVATPGSEAGAIEVLAAITERRPVYLLSGCTEEQLALTGLIPLDDEKELRRLAERQGACLLIRGGQFALPDIDRE